ncbi:MAG: C39 family peptidase [Candidatus Nealsonbacteria bacterium]|nr:C39 family peptidase [Candidatus Nealsonbacteria bacterium]
MKNIFLASIAILSLFALFLEGAIVYSHISRPAEIIEKKEAEKEAAEQPFTLPETVDLNVPFIAQAPGGDWSYPFAYTCEEAAILMARYFFEGEDFVDVPKTKIELLGLVNFEDKNYGFHEDTSAEQTARLIRDYYGYEARAVYDISLDDIKKELALGRPVIIPAAGRLLQNPNFKPPGPVYHIILLKGYNGDGFLSHDPGTANGANVLYSYEIIENAIHDLAEGDIMEGRRAMVSFGGEKKK